MISQPLEVDKNVTSVTDGVARRDLESTSTDYLSFTTIKSQSVSQGYYNNNVNKTLHYPGNYGFQIAAAIPSYNTSGVYIEFWLYDGTSGGDGYVEIPYSLCTLSQFPTSVQSQATALGVNTYYL